MTDFGAATVIEDCMKSIEHSIAGTPIYLSPELYKFWSNDAETCEYNAELNEIFSFGMTIL